MANADPIKILVVDDLPEKLLVYRTVLEEPGIEVVTASSGARALALLLQGEFAVVLLDVNMPDIDGFETAALIRARRRCAHTPIIFVTAHSDEMHALRGYAYGAVDYILAPVVPEVLRTKVGVFAELFRKSRQVQQQADELRALQEREHKRLLRETNQRLEVALQAGRMGACEWDLGPKLLAWTPALEAIFGFTPGQFDGSADALRARLHPDDAPWVVEALTAAVAAGSDFRLEHRILRPASTLEPAHASSEAWIELRGRVYPPDEPAPAHTAQAGAAANLVPHAPAGPRTPRLVGVCMDITERKRVEAELARHRAHLEDLVRERTSELQASHERLRLADRLASIGTLAAGLGHDMGNLLLPVRMRLDALDRMELPAQAREDLVAIASACEYLKRLTQGLRLLALNPADDHASGDRTDLAAWWADVSPFLRSALPRHIALEHDLPATLPHVAMSPHIFTQSIYNLVQNAGDAMKDRPSGRVRIAARAHAPASAAGHAPLVEILVADDGPGMSDEVRRRCLEPFFTTKSRGISTGLGLALVCGGVRKAGGTVEIDSAVGRGTTFRLAIPAKAAAPADAPAAPDALLAVVRVADPRTRAYVGSILRSLGVETPDPRSDARAASRARLLVTDDPAGADLDAFLAGHADDRRAVVLAPAPPHAAPRGAEFLGERPAAGAIRMAVMDAARALAPAPTAEQADAAPASDATPSVAIVADDPAQEPRRFAEVRR